MHGQRGDKGMPAKREIPGLGSDCDDHSLPPEHVHNSVRPMSREEY